MTCFLSAAIILLKMKQWRAITVRHDTEYEFAKGADEIVFVSRTQMLSQGHLRLAGCCSQLCLLRLRRPVDGAAGQHRTGVHGGHRRWPHPGALLPVPPVCRQRRGKRPVQQRDRQVSAPLHLLNVSDAAAAGLCASHRNGVALVCFHSSGTARTFPLVFSGSIENLLIISCKSSSFFFRFALVGGSER